MRLLGIDFGESRIGLSLSDPMGLIASGLDTIVWKNSNEIPFNEIMEIIKSKKVEKIIVGFPTNMNGTIGPRGERTQEFITGLNNILKENNVNIEIIKWDERLSTQAAYRTMHETNTKTKTKKKKGIVDKLAASFILQGYLDFYKGKQ